MFKPKKEKTRGILKDGFWSIQELAKFIFFVSLCTYLVLFIINAKGALFIVEHSSLNMIILAILVGSGIIFSLSKFEHEQK